MTANKTDRTYGALTSEILAWAAQHNSFTGHAASVCLNQPLKSLQAHLRYLTNKGRLRRVQSVLGCKGFTIYKLP